MRPSHVDEFIEHGYTKIKASDDLLFMLRRQLQLGRALHASTIEQKRRAAWKSLCHAVLSSNEFLYVR